MIRRYRRSTIDPVRTLTRSAGLRRVAVIAVLLGVFPGNPQTTFAQQVPVQQEPVLIGVLELEANNVEPPEARAIADRLRFHLGNLGMFRVLERNRMESILQEMGFQLSGACDTEECVIQVGRILGARKMVAGSVSRVGEIYALQVRLVDMATSGIERQAISDVQGIEAVLLEGTEDVARQLAGLQEGPRQRAGREQADPSAAEPTEGQPARQSWLPTESGWAFGLWTSAVSDEAHSGIAFGRILAEGKYLYAGWFASFARDAEGGEGTSTEFCVELDFFRSRGVRPYLGLGGTSITRVSLLGAELMEDTAGLTVGVVLQLGRLVLKVGSLPGPDGGGGAAVMWDFSRMKRN
jgi:hypothetical protein